MTKEEALKAGKLIFKLARQLRGNVYTDQSGDEKTLSNEDFVKGIEVGKSGPATAQLIQDAKRGNGRRHFRAIYDNLAEWVDRLEMDGSDLNINLDELERLIDPSQARRLSVHFVKRKIRTAKKRVYIFNTFIPGIASFGSLLNDVEDVKVVMMAPDSPFLEDRAGRLDYGMRKFHSQLKMDLQNLERLLVNQDCLRVYKEIPLMPIYIFDDEIFCGFFLHNTLAADAPQRVFDVQSDDGKLMLDEFDHIWENSKSVSDKRSFPFYRSQPARALASLVPSSDKYIDESLLNRIASEISGNYAFARFRSSSLDESFEARKAPIIVGQVSLHPFDPEVGLLKFSAELPQRVKQGDNDVSIIWFPFEGFMVPYGKHLVLIGDHKNKKDRAPTFMMLQRFDKSLCDFRRAPPEGLTLRKHPNGQVMASRVVLLQNTKSEHGFTKETLTMKTHLSEGQFRDRFEVFRSVTNLLKRDPDPHKLSPDVMRMSDHITVAASKK